MCVPVNDRWCRLTGAGSTTVGAGLSRKLPVTYVGAGLALFVGAGQRPLVSGKSFPLELVADLFSMLMQ